MTPIKLTGTGIADNDVEYTFAAPGGVQAQKTAEDVKKCILYAFYGNDALYNGEVRFAFTCGEDAYVIYRDFSANKVSLTVNGEDVPASKIDATLAGLVKMSQGQFAEYVFASKKAAYAGITQNVARYTEEIFDALKISPATASESAEELKREIAALSSKIEVLSGLAEDEKDMEKKLAELQGEIRSLETDSARLKELIGVGTVGKSTAAKLDRARAGLENALRRKDEIEGKQARLVRSEEIKRYCAILEAVAKAGQELKEIEETLAANNETLARSEAEIVTGEKILHKREREFLDATKRVKALNRAFDEMIAANRGEYKNGTYVKGLAEKAYADKDGASAALRARLDALLREDRDLNTTIAERRAALAGVRQTAEERKAMREGACFEIAIEEKQAFLAEAEASAEELRETRDALRTEVVRNKEELAICREELRILFEKTDTKKSLADLIRDYNELEHIKQSLYRNQILSAMLLQEVNAIDKKIADNTEMRRNSVENKNALESARATLVAYTEKCNEALRKKYDELNAVKAERKFFDTLDSLTYGSKCPVCSAPISDKAEAEGKARDLERKQGEIEKEIARLRGIKDEYAEKLSRINLSLGSYESAIATGSGYIKSLEQTKLAKLSALRKIYEENHVANHAELTADLEQTVAEIARYGAVIADVKGVVAQQEAAEKTLAVAQKRLEKLMNVTLPEKEQTIEALRAEIERYKTGHAGLEGLLGDGKALDKLDSVIGKEEAEDAYFEDLAKAEDRKAEVEREIDGIREELKAFDAAAYAFGEEKVSYEDFLIKAAAEQYNEVVDEIRKAEAARLRKQDEMLALDGLIKDKKAQNADIVAQNAELGKKKEINEAYVAKIKETSGFDASVAEGKTPEEIRSGILDDAEAAKLAEEIDAYEKEVLKFSSEIAALGELTEEVKDAIEGLDGNVAASLELNETLQDRMSAYAEVSNKLNLARVIGGKIAALDRERAEKQKEWNDADAIAEGHASDLLITKINNGLCALMPRLRVKLKGEGLVVISSNEKGVEKELEKLSDEEYIVVALAAINAVRQIVAETMHAQVDLRLVKVRASSLEDATQTAVVEFAKKNNLIAVLYK